VEIRHVDLSECPYDPAPMSGPAPTATTDPLRLELRWALELFALCGIAITQPVLDLFGRAPQQFAFRGVEGSGIVAFALIVALVPAAALWAALALVGVVDRRARSRVQLVLVGLLVGAVALQALWPHVSGAPRLLLSALIGLGAAAAYRSVAPVRTWLAFMSLAPVAFVALFLFASPTSQLLTSTDAVAIAGGVQRPAPVVMIVFDELPLASLIDSSGSIDEELFPNFAALAAGSHWFRNTTSVSSSTWYAVPALLTGRLVSDGPAPIAADHPESLFTFLGGAYDLNVTESVTRVCPSELCAGSPDLVGGERQMLRDAAAVMRSRLSYSGPGEDPTAGLVEPVAGERGAAAAGAGGGTAGVGEEGSSPFADFELNQPVRVQSFLDGIEDDRPALHYLHILLPHTPFRYLPSGARYAGPDPDLGRDEDQWMDEPWLADLGRQRHLLQVGYVDALLGRIVDELVDRGIYDESLLVVTSDHGISFDAGGPTRGIDGQALGEGPLADIAWVPLFVKEPGQQQGTVSDANVLTVDVLPTIADVIDAELPWDVDGRSVLGPARGGDEPKPFRRSEVNPFGVAALDELHVDDVTGFDDLRERGVDRLLPKQGAGPRWWRLGPSPELVGTAVTDPGTAAALRAVPASLESPEQFDVDPASQLLPALVVGRTEALAPGDPFALSVNGVVAATGYAHAGSDATSFAAMVADDRFRSGPNDVVLHRMATPR
jgi:hypothetical protein